MSTSTCASFVNYDKKKASSTYNVTAAMWQQTSVCSQTSFTLRYAHWSILLLLSKYSNMFQLFLQMHFEHFKNCQFEF